MNTATIKTKINTVQPIAAEQVEKESVYSTRQLNLWYGSNHALKNIDLEIGENEVTAIIGPSGCGKSTYLKTLNRMVELVPSVKTSGSSKFQFLLALKKPIRNINNLHYRTNCPLAKAFTLNITLQNGFGFIGYAFFRIPVGSGAKWPKLPRIPSL